MADGNLIVGVREMHANFDINGKKIQAWLSIESYRQDVSFEFERDEDGRDTYHDLSKDESGALFFELNGQRVYLHDMEKDSMANLASMIKHQAETGVNDEPRWLTTYDFITAMLCDGPWNTRFLVDMPVPDTIVPMMGIALVGDKTTRVPCKLKKSFNSEPHVGYKLEFEIDVDMLTPESREELPYVCTRRTYTDDIFSLIKCGNIGILPSIDDGKTQEQHIDEYFAEYAKK